MDNGQTDRWTDGWMDRPMDALMDKNDFIGCCQTEVECPKIEEIKKRWK